MSDFGHISKEEHQEWLRSPATSAAVSELREQLTMANHATASASATASIETIRFQAGFAAGVSHVINLLTKERK